MLILLLELFSIFWTRKVHYKLQQSTLQNFDDGGLLSGWCFVRVVFSPGLTFLVVFCPVVFGPVVFCPGFSETSGKGCSELVQVCTSVHLQGWKTLNISCYKHSIPLQLS